jgi:glucose/arabinose dehydrogenase/plastocyanin
MRFRMIWTPLLVFALAFGLFHGPVLAQQDDPQTTIPGQEDPQLPYNPQTATEPIEQTYEIELELVAEGFTSPVYLTYAPDDSGRLFVVDQAGVLYIIDEDGELLEEPFLDLTDQIVELQEGFDERGVLGLAFHPDYTENGRLFVHYSAPLRDGAPEEWNHTSHISEFRVMLDDENQVDLASERIILQVDQPQFNHNGGTIKFGPDGYLYISFGDGGGANDTGEGHVQDWYEYNEGGNAQARENLLGAILRIDIDPINNNDNGNEQDQTAAAEMPYTIPEDNPFVDEDGEDEIYVYGLRNPYRFSFDRDGEYGMFIGDVGQDLFEEINLVEEAGQNFGWSVREGTHCFDAANPMVPPTECPDIDDRGEPLVDPVIEYLHANVEDGIGISLINGYLYRGSDVAGLQGNFVFGDWSQSFAEPGGRLFMAEPQDEGLWPITELIVTGEHEGFEKFVLGFGEDQDGELYVLTTEMGGPTGDTGTVYRIISTEAEVDGEAVITETSFDLTAQGMFFDRNEFTVPAGAQVVIEFNNEEQLPHNFSLYESSDAQVSLFAGEIITGPDTITYEFTAPEEPGEYYFQCDVHPQMNGQFIVEEN